MATSLNEIVTKLEKGIRFQETPIQLDIYDYQGFVLDGAKRLYVDMGYSGWDDEYDDIKFEVSRDFTLSEKEYVFIASLIKYYDEIKTHWSTILGYSTDAITVTYPQKPWENITGEIERLENRINTLFYKISSIGGGSE